MASVAALALGASTADATIARCSSFGPSWRRAYNTEAAKDGNPVRILAACCKPGPSFGESACSITVTLVGTTDRGCESVVLSSKGIPIGPGKHETCTA